MLTVRRLESNYKTKNTLKHQKETEFNNNNNNKNPVN